MKKFGVISLTQNKLDILMWAYYAQNKGFVVEFDTAKMNKKWYGPFPVNYCRTLNKLEYARYSPLMSLFYQTNVKYDSWEHETEWRYLTFNPKGNYHPYYLKNDYKSRFEYYDRNAITQIILGYDFIEPNFIERVNNVDHIKLRNKMSDYKLKRRILNFLVASKIPVSRIIRDNRDFSLEIEKITIKKISPNKFEIES